MLIHATQEKLTGMRLLGMAKAFEEQLGMSDIAQMSFEDRLGLLVDREESERQNKKFKNRIRRAKSKETAFVEDIDFKKGRGLEKSVLLTLASGEWIRRHQNIIITGPAGVGKTYVACALLHSACKEGFTSKYLRVPRFIRDLETAKSDGSYDKLLKELARTDVLLLDDLGLAKISSEEARDLLEIMDDRHATKSTIFTSQVVSSKWYELIKDPTVADALLDRIIHRAHQLELTGESMRKEKSGLTKKAKSS